MWVLLVQCTNHGLIFVILNVLFFEVSPKMPIHSSMKWLLLATTLFTYNRKHSIVPGIAGFLKLFFIYSLT